jgi:glycosyltransferase involved in cell wall biosynthesis
MDMPSNEKPTPQLSVVVPHLNEPGDLSRCLAALDRERQDGARLEIIVVDNGSATPPVEVCAAFEDVRLEIETTPGPGPARNRGVAAANAPLVAFVDCDCFVQPGWAAAVLNHMLGHPETDFAGGDIGILPADPGRLSAIECYESVFSYRNDLYVARMGFSATGNMVVRRTVFEAVGPFGGIGSMEDTEWGQRASAQGHRIAYIGEDSVRTPSCRDFAELKRRWDRHVAHEFRHVRGQRGRVARWVVRAGLVLASPAREIPTLIRTPRLHSIRERLLAFACLVRVRARRSRVMLELALNDDAGARVGSWNRERPGLSG